MKNEINNNINSIIHYYNNNSNDNINPILDNFNFDYYKKSNKDLNNSKLNEKTLFNQWKSHGLKKNNIGKPISFNYINNTFFSFSAKLSHIKILYDNLDKQIKLSSNNKNIQYELVFKNIEQMYILPYLFIDKKSTKQKFVNYNKYS